MVYGERTEESIKFQDEPARPEEYLPVLPYGQGPAATSGHSGGDTSRERAERADKDGSTAFRQRATMAYLHAAGRQGVTWKELAQAEVLHHGQASGALSNLHKDNLIARLTERRERCFVYVLPWHVDGRETQSQGRTKVTEMVMPTITDEERLYVQHAARAAAHGWTVPGRRVATLLRIIERHTGEKFLD